MTSLLALMSVFITVSLSSMSDAAMRIRSMDLGLFVHLLGCLGCWAVGLLGCCGCIGCVGCSFRVKQLVNHCEWTGPIRLDCLARTHPFDS